MNNRLSHVFKWMESQPEYTARVAVVVRQKKVERVSKNTWVNRRYAANAGVRMRSKFTSRLNYYMNNRLLINRDTRFGCSQWELRRHIESLFLPCMTWENYGEHWEVDHVYPTSKFKLPEEILSCFHYTNLRPRIGVINRMEGMLLRLGDVPGARMICATRQGRSCAVRPSAGL